MLIFCQMTYYVQVDNFYVDGELEEEILMDLSSYTPSGVVVHSGRFEAALHAHCGESQEPDHSDVQNNLSGYLP